jgi:hypothetical protein
MVIKRKSEMKVDLSEDGWGSVGLGSLLQNFMLMPKHFGNLRYLGKFNWNWLNFKNYFVLILNFSHRFLIKNLLE